MVRHSCYRHSCYRPSSCRHSCYHQKSNRTDILVTGMTFGNRNVEKIWTYCNIRSTVSLTFLNNDLYHFKISFHSSCQLSFMLLVIPVTSHSCYHMSFLLLLINSFIHYKIMDDHFVGDNRQSSLLHWLLSHRGVCMECRDTCFVLFCLATIQMPSV